MPSVRVVICGAVLCLSCSDADEDDTVRLQQFLSGELELAEGDALELNRAFARSAVRGGGYARHGALSEQPEFWSPVVRWDGQNWQPSDVTPWIGAGDIDENGYFLPCRRQACADEPLIGAVNRLFDVSRIEWSESPWAIELEAGEARINPRLFELVDPTQPEPEAAPPAAALKPQAGPPLRSHDPPPEVESSDSSGCDCDDFIDIDCSGDSANNTSSGNNNCSVAHARALPINLHTLALAAALAWVVRRSSAFSRRLRRALAALLALSVVVLTNSTALAQTGDARASVEAGKKALLAKDYAIAIRELERARQQGAGAEALAPLAQAYEGAGQLPEAYVALSELGPSAEPKLKKLEPELAFVSLQITPPHAVLGVDGRPAAIDAKSRQLVVTPGPHVLSAKADGFAPAEQPFQAERGTRNTVVSLALAQPVTVTVRGFAPDAVIALDGTPVGAGQWTGSVAPGPHLVQVYKPGGPAYDFPFTAVAGQSVQLPPPEVAPAPLAAAPIPQKKRRLNRGLFVLGHLGFFALTANPDGFQYDLVRDDDTGELREGAGLMWWTGASVGYRLTRAFGLGGLLMYGRGGGEGNVTQLESNGGGGTLSHTGPADLTLQFIRLGPHFRFMAGGDVARFLGSASIGVSYQMVDLIHVDVVQQGGVLIERGNFEHNETGIGPYWGFDVGAEFNPGDHLLLGVAFDFYLDRTNAISGDPYGGTAQGYVGFSARVGYHDWQAVD